MHPEGLHHREDGSAASGEVNKATCEALIRGGGWAGSVILIWSKIACTSFSGWVWRGSTSQRPSTMGIHTSTIWIVASFSNTAAGVNPGAWIIRRFFKVTCRQ